MISPVTLPVKTLQSNDGTIMPQHRALYDINVIEADAPNSITHAIVCVMHDNGLGFQLLPDHGGDPLLMKKLKQEKMISDTARPSAGLCGISRFQQ